MAEEQGLVDSTNNNGLAQVITERKDACGDCESSHCCTSLESRGKMSIKALNRVGAKVGDVVRISLSSVSLLKSAFLLYIIPLIGFISGAIMGAALHDKLSLSETAASIVFGFIGLFLGFLLVRPFTQRMSRDNRLTPVITEIINSGRVSHELMPSVDPVCKMIMEPTKDTPSSVYKDQTYYFCDPRCKETFKRDPEKYLN